MVTGKKLLNLSIQYFEIIFSTYNHCIVTIKLLNDQVELFRIYLSLYFLFILENIHLSHNATLQGLFTYLCRLLAIEKLTFKSFQ